MTAEEHYRISFTVSIPKAGGTFTFEENGPAFDTYEAATAFTQHAAEVLPNATFMVEIHQGQLRSWGKPIDPDQEEQ